ncbi:MAG: hypothetical protein RL589_59 [Actinomycetota bacterium]|jgi:hypothetical protein
MNGYSTLLTVDYLSAAGVRQIDTVLLNTISHFASIIKG